MSKFELLTKHIATFESDNFGEWFIDKENDGSAVAIGSSDAPTSNLFNVIFYICVILLFVGIVVLASINLVITPPIVSIPNDNGVTSNKRTSFTSPVNTPPWMAAPTATTSSGFTPFEGAFPQNWPTIA